MTAPSVPPTALPPADDVVLRSILERRAVDPATAGRTCVAFEDGEDWDYGGAVQRAHGAAAALASHGVGQDDLVLVLLPNGPDWMLAWWGTAFLGATIVPVNVALVGGPLRHLVTDCGARTVVTDAEMAGRIRDLDLGVTIVDAAELRHPAAEPVPAPARPLQPWDTHSVMYTSGTTGPSKGVITPYLHTAMAASLWTQRARPDDRMLIDLPLFHIGGMNPSYATWSVGAAVVVAPKFSASGYLDRVRRLGITTTLLVGSIPAFLYSQPQRADDADSPWRSAMSAPCPPDTGAFVRRFGLDELWTTFGMTEVAAPLATPLGGTAVGVGVPRPGYEVRLVDEHDVEVPVGVVGELIVRHELPWAMNAGYLGRPAATAAAWRNGWFHTGDLFIRDAEGNHFFRDRTNDAIRRRGENISSFEVEAEVLAHPAVSEAACIGVPDGYGGDEVKVFVVPVVGATVDPAELYAFLEPRMPRFMLPRFVEVIDELPKSTNNRVRKVALRERPASSSAWEARPTRGGAR